MICFRIVSNFPLYVIIYACIINWPCDAGIDRPSEHQLSSDVVIWYSILWIYVIGFNFTSTCIFWI